MSLGWAMSVCGTFLKLLFDPFKLKLPAYDNWIKERGKKME